MSAQGALRIHEYRLDKNYCFRILGDLSSLRCQIQRLLLLSSSQLSKGYQAYCQFTDLLGKLRNVNNLNVKFPDF